MAASASVEGAALVETDIDGMASMEMGKLLEAASAGTLESFQNLARTRQASGQDSPLVWGSTVAEAVSAVADHEDFYVPKKNKTCSAFWRSVLDDNGLDLLIDIFDCAPRGDAQGIVARAIDACAGWAARERSVGKQVKDWAARNAPAVLDVYAVVVQGGARFHYAADCAALLLRGLVYSVEPGLARKRAIDKYVPKIARLNPVGKLLLESSRLYVLSTDASAFGEGAELARSVLVIRLLSDAHSVVDSLRTSAHAVHAAWIHAGALRLLSSAEVAADTIGMGEDAFRALRAAYLAADALRVSLRYTVAAATVTMQTAPLPGSLPGEPTSAQVEEWILEGLRRIVEWVDAEQVASKEEATAASKAAKGKKSASKSRPYIWKDPPELIGEIDQNMLRNLMRLSASLPDEAQFQAALKKAKEAAAARASSAPTTTAAGAGGPAKPKKRKVRSGGSVASACFTNDAKHSNVTIEDGNMYARSTGGGNSHVLVSIDGGETAHAIESGVVSFEVKLITDSSGGECTNFGIVVGKPDASSAVSYSSGHAYQYRCYNGAQYSRGSQTATVDTMHPGDTIKMTINADERTMEMEINGKSQSSKFTGISDGPIYVCCGFYSSDRKIQLVSYSAGGASSGVDVFAPLALVSIARKAGPGPRGDGTVEELLSVAWKESLPTLSRAARLHNVIASVYLSCVALHSYDAEDTVAVVSRGVGAAASADAVEGTTIDVELSSRVQEVLWATAELNNLANKAGSFCLCPARLRRPKTEVDLYKCVTCNPEGVEETDKTEEPVGDAPLVIAGLICSECAKICHVGHTVERVRSYTGKAVCTEPTSADYAGPELRPIRDKLLASQVVRLLLVVPGSPRIPSRVKRAAIHALGSLIEWTGSRLEDVVASAAATAGHAKGESTASFRLPLSALASFGDTLLAKEWAQGSIQDLVKTLDFAASVGSSEDDLERQHCVAVRHWIIGVLARIAHGKGPERIRATPQELRDSHAVLALINSESELPQAMQLRASALIALVTVESIKDGMSSTDRATREGVLRLLAAIETLDAQRGDERGAAGATGGAGSPATSPSIQSILLDGDVFGHMLRVLNRAVDTPASAPRGSARDDEIEVEVIEDAAEAHVLVSDFRIDALKEVFRWAQHHDDDLRRFLPSPLTSGVLDNLLWLNEGLVAEAVADPVRQELGKASSFRATGIEPIDGPLIAAVKSADGQLQLYSDSRGVHCVKAGSIRTVLGVREISREAPYFEVTLDQCKPVDAEPDSPSVEARIGLAVPSYDRKTMLGDAAVSFAFSSVAGLLHGNGSTAGALSPWAERGVTVGCGVDFSEMRVYYTVEGTVVGTFTCSATDLEKKLLPAVSMAGPDVKLRLNLGPRFRFNLAGASPPGVPFAVNTPLSVTAEGTAACLTAETEECFTGADAVCLEVATLDGSQPVAVSKLTVVTPTLQVDDDPVAGVIYAFSKKPTAAQLQSASERSFTKSEVSALPLTTERDESLPVAYFTTEDVELWEPEIELVCCSGDATLSKDGTISVYTGFPSIRAKDVKLTTGKWYYEIHMKSAGCFQIGWGNQSYTGSSGAGEGVGDDTRSWGYDAYRQCKWHGGSTRWGRGDPWKVGEVIGCAVDLDAGTVSFARDGNWASPMGQAFDGVRVDHMFPVLSASSSQSARMVFRTSDFKFSGPSPEYKSVAASVIVEDAEKSVRVPVLPRGGKLLCSLEGFSEASGTGKVSQKLVPAWDSKQPPTVASEPVVDGVTMVVERNGQSSVTYTLPSEMSGPGCVLDTAVALDDTCTSVPDGVVAQFQVYVNSALRWTSAPVEPAKQQRCRVPVSSAASVLLRVKCSGPAETLRFVWVDPAVLNSRTEPIARYLVLKLCSPAKGVQRLNVWGRVPSKGADRGARGAAAGGTASVDRDEDIGQMSPLEQRLCLVPSILRAQWTSMKDEAGGIAQRLESSAVESLLRSLSLLGSVATEPEVESAQALLALTTPADLATVLKQTASEATRIQGALPANLRRRCLNASRLIATFDDIEKEAHQSTAEIVDCGPMRWEIESAQRRRELVRADISSSLVSLCGLRTRDPAFPSREMIDEEVVAWASSALAVVVNWAAADTSLSRRSACEWMSILEDSMSSDPSHVAVADRMSRAVLNAKAFATAGAKLPLRVAVVQCRRCLRLALPDDEETATGSFTAESLAKCLTSCCPSPSPALHQWAISAAQRRVLKNAIESLFPKHGETATVQDIFVLRCKACDGVVFPATASGIATGPINGWDPTVSSMQATHRTRVPDSPFWSSHFEHDLSAPAHAPHISLSCPCALALNVVEDDGHGDLPKGIEVILVRLTRTTAAELADAEGEPHSLLTPEGVLRMHAKSTTTSSAGVVGAGRGVGASSKAKFVSQSDASDSSMVSSGIDIRDGGKKVYSTSSSAHAIVPVGFSRGKATWTFRLTEDRMSDECAVMGAACVPNSSGSSYQSSSFYMYRAYNGAAYGLGTQTWSGPAMHKGDTIKFSLDMSAKTLGVELNGSAVNKWENITWDTVYPAVCFYGSSREVELVECKALGGGGKVASATPQTSVSLQLASSFMSRLLAAIVTSDKSGSLLPRLVEAGAVGVLMRALAAEDLGDVFPKIDEDLGPDARAKALKEADDVRARLAECANVALAEVTSTSLVVAKIDRSRNSTARITAGVLLQFFQPSLLFSVLEGSDVRATLEVLSLVGKVDRLNQLCAVNTSDVAGDLLKHGIIQRLVNLYVPSDSSGLREGSLRDQALSVAERHQRGRLAHSVVASLARMLEWAAADAALSTKAQMEWVSEVNAGSVAALVSLVISHSRVASTMEKQRSQRLASARVDDDAAEVTKEEEHAVDARAVALFAATALQQLSDPSETKPATAAEVQAALCDGLHVTDLLDTLGSSTDDTVEIRRRVARTLVQIFRADSFVKVCENIEAPNRQVAEMLRLCVTFDDCIEAAAYEGGDAMSAREIATTKLQVATSGGLVALLRLFARKTGASSGRGAVSGVITEGSSSAAPGGTSAPDIRYTDDAVRDATVAAFDVVCAWLSKSEHAERPTVDWIRQAIAETPADREERWSPEEFVDLLLNLASHARVATSPAFSMVATNITVDMTYATDLAVGSASFSPDKRTATSNGSSVCCPADVEFSEGEASWTIEITNDSHGDECSCLGLCTVPVTNGSYSASSQIRAIRAYNGQVHDCGSSTKTVSKLHQGDTITFKVNFDTGAVDLNVNGADYPEVWTGVSGPVRPCACFYSGGRSVKLGTATFGSSGAKPTAKWKAVEFSAKIIGELVSSEASIDHPEEYMQAAIELGGLSMLLDLARADEAAIRKVAAVAALNFLKPKSARSLIRTGSVTDSVPENVAQCQTHTLELLARFPSLARFTGRDFVALRAELVDAGLIPSILRIQRLQSDPVATSTAVATAVPENVDESELKPLETDVAPAQMDRALIRALATMLNCHNATAKAGTGTPVSTLRLDDLAFGQLDANSVANLVWFVAADVLEDDDWLQRIDVDDPSLPTPLDFVRFFAARALKIGTSIPAGEKAPTPEVLNVHDWVVRSGGVPALMNSAALDLDGSQRALRKPRSKLLVMEESVRGGRRGYGRAAAYDPYGYDDSGGITVLEVEGESSADPGDVNVADLSMNVAQTIVNIFNVDKLVSALQSREQGGEEAAAALERRAATVKTMAAILADLDALQLAAAGRVEADMPVREDKLVVRSTGGRRRRAARRYARDAYGGYRGYDGGYGAGYGGGGYGYGGYGGGYGGGGYGYGGYGGGRTRRRAKKIKKAKEVKKLIELSPLKSGIVEKGTLGMLLTFPRMEDDDLSFIIYRAIGRVLEWIKSSKEFSTRDLISWVPHDGSSDRAQLVPMLLMLVDSVSGSSKGTADHLSKTAPVATAKKGFAFTWDSATTQNVGLEEDGTMASSTGSGYAVASRGFAAGKVSWKVKLVKDNKDDECSVFGVCTKPVSDSSYNTANRWTYRAYNGATYASASTGKTFDKVHQDDVVKFTLDMSAGTLTAAINDKDPQMLFSDLKGKGELFPCVFFYGSSRKVQLTEAKIGGVTGRTASSEDVQANVIEFACSALADLIGPKSSVARRARTVMMNQGGVNRLLSAANEKTPVVTRVLLNVLGERRILRSMRLHNDPMSLSELIVSMYDAGIVGGEGTRDTVLLPDLLSELLLMAGSRAEKERKCAFAFLKLPCCLEVQANKEALLVLHLMRHLVSWLEHSAEDVRSSGLQILLKAIKDDPDTEVEFVRSPGGVKSVFRCLAKELSETNEEGINTASAAIAELCGRSKFVAKMFLRDVGGLRVLMSGMGAIDMGGASGKREPVVFDSTSCANVTLSADNMSARSNSWSNGYALATKGYNKGKHRWAIKVVNETMGDESSACGVAVKPVTTNNYNGSGFWTLRFYNGQLYADGNTTSTFSAVHQGDIVEMVLDCTAGTLKYFKNGTELGIGFTGLQGRELYPCVGFYSSGRELAFVDPKDIKKELGKGTESSSATSASDFELNFATAMARISGDKVYRRSLVNPLGRGSKSSALSALAKLLEGENIAAQLQAADAVANLVSNQEFQKAVILSCLKPLCEVIIVQEKDVFLAHIGVDVLERLGNEATNHRMLLRPTRIARIKECIEACKFAEVQQRMMRFMIGLIETAETAAEACNEQNVVVTLSAMLRPTPSEESTGQVLGFEDMARTLHAIQVLAGLESSHKDIATFSLPEIKKLEHAVLDAGQAYVDEVGVAGADQERAVGSRVSAVRAASRPGSAGPAAVPDKTSVVDSGAQAGVTAEEGTTSVPAAADEGYESKGVEDAARGSPLAVAAADEGTVEEKDQGGDSDGDEDADGQGQQTLEDVHKMLRLHGPELLIAALKVPLALLEKSADDARIIPTMEHVISLVETVMQNEWAKSHRHFITAFMGTLAHGVRRIVSRPAEFPPRQIESFVHRLLGMVDRGLFDMREIEGLHTEDRSDEVEEDGDAAVLKAKKDGVSHPGEGAVEASHESDEEEDVNVDRADFEDSYINLVLRMLSLLIKRARTSGLRREFQSMVFEKLFGGKSAAVDVAAGDTTASEVAAGAEACQTEGQSDGEKPAAQSVTEPVAQEGGADDATAGQGGQAPADEKAKSDLVPTPKTKRKRKTRSHPEILLRTTSGPFFIQLLADLCFDRGLDDEQRYKIQQLVPLSEAVRVIEDKRYPMFVRAAFTDLISAGFVDCDPHSEIRMINTVRSHLGEEPNRGHVTPEALTKLLTVLRRLMLRELRIGSDLPFWSEDGTEAKGLRKREDEAMRRAEASGVPLTSESDKELLHLHLRRVFAKRVLRVFSKLVLFGVLPDRASVLEYYRRFEMELQRVLDSELLHGRLDRDEEALIVSRFGSEVAVMAHPAVKWKRYTTGLFTVLHSLHQLNIDALLTDAMRFYGRHSRFIDATLQRASRQGSGLDKFRDALSATVRGGADVFGDRSWLKDVQAELSPLLTSASLDPDKTQRLLNVTGHGNPDLVTAALQMLVDQHQELVQFAKEFRACTFNVAAGIANAAVANDSSDDDEPGSPVSPKKKPRWAESRSTGDKLPKSESESAKVGASVAAPATVVVVPSKRESDVSARAPYEEHYFEDEDTVSSIPLSPELIKGLHLFVNEVAASFEQAGQARMDELYNALNSDLEVFIQPQLRAALHEEDTVDVAAEYESSGDEGEGGALLAAAEKSEARERAADLPQYQGNQVSGSRQGHKLGSSSGCYVIDLVRHLASAGHVHDMPLRLARDVVAILCNVALNSLARSAADGRVVVDNTTDIEFVPKNLSRLYRRSLVVFDTRNKSGSAAALRNAADSGGASLWRRALIATPMAHIRDVLVQHGAAPMVTSLIGLASRRLLRVQFDDRSGMQRYALELLSNVGHFGQWLLYDANPRVQQAFANSFTGTDKRPKWSDDLGIAVPLAPDQLHGSGFLAETSRMLSHLATITSSRKNLLTERPDLMGVYLQRVSSTADRPGGRRRDGWGLRGHIDADAMRAAQDSDATSVTHSGSDTESYGSDEDRPRRFGRSRHRRRRGDDVDAVQGGGGANAAAGPAADDEQGAAAASHEGGISKALSFTRGAAASVYQPIAQEASDMKRLVMNGHGAATVGGKAAPDAEAVSAPDPADSAVAVHTGVRSRQKESRVSRFATRRLPAGLKGRFGARQRDEVEKHTEADERARWQKLDETLRARVKLYATRLRIMPTLSSTMEELVRSDATMQDAIESVSLFLQLSAEGNHVGVKRLLWKRNLPSVVDGSFVLRLTDVPKAKGVLEEHAALVRGGDDDGSGASASESEEDGDDDDAGAASEHDEGEGDRSKIDLEAVAVGALSDESEPSVISRLLHLGELITKQMSSNSRAYGSLYGSLRMFTALCEAKARDMEHLSCVVDAIHEIFQSSEELVRDVVPTEAAADSSEAEVAARLTGRKAALHLRRKTALAAWSLVYHIFDYTAEEEAVYQRMLKARVKKEGARQRLRRFGGFEDTHAPWRARIDAALHYLMQLEKTAVRLGYVVMKALLDGAPYDAVRSPGTPSEGDVIVRSNRQVLLASIHHKDRLNRLVERLGRHFNASKRAGTWSYDEPRKGSAAGDRRAYATKLQASGRTRGSNLFYGQGGAMGTAAASSARYGFGQGARHDRALRDELIFYLYQLLHGLSPRLLERRFGSDVVEIKAHVGTIEIVRDGELEVLTFPTPLAVRNAARNEQVKWAVRALKRSESISRDFHVNKLRDFVRESDGVINVIKCQDELSRLGQLRGATGNCSSFVSALRAKAEHAIAVNEMAWYYSAMVISMVINAVLAFVGVADRAFHEEGEGDHDGLGWLRSVQGIDADAHVWGITVPAPYGFVVRILGFVHLVCAVLLFVSWVAVPGRVFLARAQQKKLQRQREATGSSLGTQMVVEVFESRTAMSDLLHRFNLFRSVQFLAHLGYVVMSLAGNVVSPVFFAIELFALTKRVPIFNEVLYSVVKNPTRLVSTVILAVILMWLYVLIGLHFFFEKYTFPDLEAEGYCDSLASCFRTHILFGTASPPIFQNVSNLELLFSFTYNVVIVWVVVALVSAIIIDNLGELRDIRAAIADDLERRCFICNIGRQVFEDLNEDGFNRHVKQEHNIWDYLSFMLYLELTDEFELSASEQYVLEKLHQRGVPGARWYEFFPARVAAQLRTGQQHRNILMNSFSDLGSRVDALENSLRADTKNVVKQLAKIESKISSS